MASKVSYKFNMTKFTTFVEKEKRKFNEKGIKTMNEVGRVFVREAQRNCPVRTRKLKNSIGKPSREGIFRKRMTQKTYELEIGTKVSYAGIVELGIRTAYTIVPRTRKALKFITKQGKIVFAKKVIHPPMRGKFFMRKAAIATQRKIAEIAKRFMQ